jgi:hypothetical protein
MVTFTTPVTTTTLTVTTGHHSARFSMPPPGRHALSYSRGCGRECAQMGTVATWAPPSMQHHARCINDCRCLAYLGFVSKESSVPVPMAMYSTGTPCRRIPVVG